MNDKRRIRISKFISKHLRHEPETIGLVLESGGWVAIGELLASATQAGFPFTREELDRVVADCDNQRFAVDESGTKIRANQGHSAEVDLQFEPADPPVVLFHGTAIRNIESILRDGLRKMSRHHVHLASDKDTALKVGTRHGKPIVLVVDAARMRGEGHFFFRSANGVWLVECVPSEYLRILTAEN